MINSKISIGLIIHKNTNFLPFFMQCINKQSCKNIEVLVHDNNEGKNEDYIKTNFPTIKYTTSNNLGFGKAHNKMIIAATGDFYLCANTTQIFDDDYLEQLIKALNIDSEHYAAAVGKIKFLNLDKYDSKLNWNKINAAKTNTIDTAGLIILDDHHVIDRAQGELDNSELDHFTELFGASGCSIMFRIATLDIIRYQHEFFDEAIFMYREDVELFYRFALANYKTIYTPRAHAWYIRTAANYHGHNLIASAINRLFYQKNKNAKFYSSLAQDYFLRKHFYPNADRFSKKIKNKTKFTQNIRLLWRFIFEPKTINKITQVLTHLCNKLSKKKKHIQGFTNIKAIEDWINNPIRHITEPTTKPVLLSLSLISRLNSNKSLQNTLDFIRQVKDWEITDGVEILLILNSDNNENFLKLQDTIKKLKFTNDTFIIKFITQNKVRSFFTATSYTTAHNQGQSFATGKIRMMINHDINISNLNIKKLLHIMENHPKIGFLAPKIINTNQKLQNTARSFPSLTAQIINRIPFLQKYLPTIHKHYNLTNLDHKTASNIDWICGHIILINDNLWHKLHGLDERFFLYMSDTDMCRRAHKLGYQVVYNPLITATNHSQLSSRGQLLKIISSPQIYIHINDSLKYYLKYLFH